MDEIRRRIIQALHDTREGGTAVLGAESGARGVVQWIGFGRNTYMVEVVDPAKHGPGFLGRLFGKPSPVGLNGEQIRALEELGFNSGEHGYEYHTYPHEPDYEQLAEMVIRALEVVGLDGEPVSIDVF